MGLRVLNCGLRSKPSPVRTQLHRRCHSLSPQRHPISSIEQRAANGGQSEQRVYEGTAIVATADVKWYDLRAAVGMPGPLP
jgi:hypothetical protein